jgi:hypothetical protein
VNLTQGREWIKERKMTEKQLTLNQQLALMPASIPDSIVDFLEDFNYATALQTDGARSAFDQDYLKNSGDTLKTELEALRSEMGKLTQLKVDAAGREIPGGFMVKLIFERGARGLGVLTRLKERTILKLVFVPGDYDENTLKESLRNPK